MPVGNLFKSYKNLNPLGSFIITVGYSNYHIGKFVFAMKKVIFQKEIIFQR